MLFKTTIQSALLAGLLVPSNSNGQTSAWPVEPADAVHFFENRVRPLLVARCFSCHSTASAQGSLRLDSREALLRGGESGPAILAGNPGQSLLLKVVQVASDPSHSAAHHRLTPEQVARLATWIRWGAPFPAGSSAPARDDPGHWSFQPLRTVTVPNPRNQRWPRTEVDRFILARIEAAGLSPASAASKRALIRRATFDLIGLPPTPGEVDFFLGDSSPNAFEKVVERLLASPRYGERWGRHWLDVARYADSSGDSSDYPIPQAHLYRNYVIASFNQDKPYDLFLREQLAGDLMPSQSEAERNERIIATGFVALSRRFAVGNKETEHLTIEDTLDTVGRGILGLTMSCARCHDHKHDPISMPDYYALYGIFASTRYPHPGSEERKYQTNLVPLISASELDARLKPHREKVSALDAEIARFEIRLDQLQEAGGDTEKLRPDYEKLWKQRAAVVADPPYIESAYAVSDDQPHNARVQKRGEPHNLAEEVPRGFLRVLGGQRLGTNHSTSGRLELANWVTSPTNPLTTRVMVNRIWQGHFGKGLVRTPSDFGTKSSPPTHPELLDYLAARFIESSWSIKAMHRLIMNSATYQQSSGKVQLSKPVTSEPVVSKAAPTDLLFTDSLIAAFPRRRLDAEQIRDALLAVSGTLDLEPGGAHPFPAPKTWDFTQHKQFNAVYDTRKRSVYLMQQRIRRHPFLAVFDGADANVSTSERIVTTTPIQALFSLNDPFVHEQAEIFAERLLREAKDNRQRIDRAHQLAFGRPADAQETSAGVSYLRQFTTKLRETGVPGEEHALRSWSSYARALLGSNEFLFVD